MIEALVADADGQLGSGLDWSGRVGHVIVCGLHDEGLRLVEQMRRAGVATIVVDDHPDTRLPRHLVPLGVPLLVADSGQEASLVRAGIAGAAALVATESDDLRTLAAALLAREMQPGLRVVAQLRNASVGRALHGVGVEVLDTAELAAPSLVEACLRTAVHPLDIEGQSMLVATATIDHRTTTRERFGDLVPLAVTTAAGDLILSPSRDLPIEAGGAVVLLGTEVAVRRAGLVPEPETRLFRGARHPRTDRPRQVGLVRFLFSSLDRPIKLAVGCLLALAVTSVAVLLIGYREPDGTRMSLLDAAYFTIETICTVGFGDFNFRDQEPWLRVWSIVVMLGGWGLATVVFALLTNLLITRTLAQSLGGRRVTGAHDHVVVVGVGAIGMAVVLELRRRQVEVVVVEADEHARFLRELRQLGVPVVIADATLPATWQSVNLSRARAVVTLTSDDLVNIETGLAVRDLLGARWPQVPVVLRVFDDRLARTVAGSFDFRYVRSPSALAAPRFVGAALGLQVPQTFYAADRPMLVARWNVSAGLVATALRDLPSGVRVVAVRGRDEELHLLPGGDRELRTGDVATLVGPAAELWELLRS